MKNDSPEDLHRLRQLELDADCSLDDIKGSGARVL